MKKRMIHPDFWDDPKVGKLSDTERIFFIGCISMADDEGRLIAEPGNLRLLWKYHKIKDEEIEKIRNAVINKTSGLILYKVNNIEYIQIKNWHKYQQIRKDMYKPSNHPAPPGWKTKTEIKKEAKKEKFLTKKDEEKIKKLEKEWGINNGKK